MSEYRHLMVRCRKCGLGWIVGLPPRRCPECGAFKWRFQKAPGSAS